MTDYYDAILQTTLDHLKSNQDPAQDLMTATLLMEQVLNAEPNVNKQIVTQLYDELRHRIESQFDDLYMQLSIKEDAV